jgi:hypothetical protein
MGAGETPIVPAGTRIELAEHDQQLIGGCMEARGERGNGVAELNDAALTLGSGWYRGVAGEFGDDERGCSGHIAS